MTVIAMILVGQTLSSAPPNDSRIEQWIAALASDSYTSRKLSARRLVELARRDSDQAGRIKTLLRTNPPSPADLELYLAKRELLLLLEQNAREIEMDRFVFDPAFDHDTVVGWDHFRRHAGDGLDARLVYSAAIKDRPGFGAQLERSGDQSLMLPEIDAIDRRDIASWSILLVAACEQAAKVADADTLRLTATLRCTGTGPMPRRDHERKVVSRLIASYLARAPIEIRDRIVIGLRFDCTDMIESDCRRVLADRTQSPSRIVTAMLAASAIDFSPTEIDRWLEAFETDSRVSHVWRSMMPPKMTHRTQIRDVAFALKLHRAGIDPRTRGFAALVADPILVFRPYSLGFESDETRRRAHANR